jgi:hypothetical protein
MERILTLEKKALAKNQLNNLQNQKNVQFDFITNDALLSSSLWSF